MEQKDNITKDSFDNFLKKNAPQAPQEPSFEYRQIMQKIQSFEKEKFGSNFSWKKWLLPLVPACCVLLVFVLLTVQNLFSTNQTVADQEIQKYFNQTLIAFYNTDETNDYLSVENRLNELANVISKEKY